MENEVPSAGEITLNGGPAGSSHVAYDPGNGGVLWRTFCQIPDMINGNVADFKPIFVSASLPARWHWVDDSQVVNLESKAHFQARAIRYAALYSTRLSQMNASVTESPALRRKMAMILAFSREAIKSAWGILLADLVPSQVATDATVPSLAANGTATVVGNPLDDEAAAEYLLMPNILTELGQEFLDCVVKASIGQPVCHGATIISTDIHHCAGHEKQLCNFIIQEVFGRTPQLPNDIDLDTLKEILCHKMSHAIKSEVLVRLARSPHSRVKLMNINLSVAARIPAKYPQEKASYAICTLVKKAAESVSEANVALDIAPALAMDAEVRNHFDSTRNGYSIQDAKRDSQAVIDNFKASHGYDVAWLAGFLKEMYSDTNTTRRTRSVLNEKTIQNLVVENSVGEAQGVHHYQMYRCWNRARARTNQNQCILPGVGCMGSDAPKDCSKVQAPVPSQASKK